MRFSEGRRVVEALEQLKLPNEAAMGHRELACLAVGETVIRETPLYLL